MKLKYPLISIIVTTRNEEEVVNKLLSSIKKLRKNNQEIILVDNFSADNTIKIARKYEIKIYEYGYERSAQRNFGAKVAKGEYLLFLDADMELGEGVIDECIKTVKSDKNVGALIIPEESYSHSFWEKVKAFERSYYNLDDSYLTDAARFFKRSIFLKSGGYDETITGPEDWDLTESIKKSGIKVKKINKLIYHYERVSSLFSLARKKFYYGLKAHRYLKKQRIHLIGPKTIYFLRPVFYKNLDKIISHPILSLGLVLMLLIELFGGGLGYLVGRIRKL